MAHFNPWYRPKPESQDVNNYDAARRDTIKHEDQEYAWPTLAAHARRQPEPSGMPGPAVCAALGVGLVVAGILAVFIVCGVIRLVQVLA